MSTTNACVHAQSPNCTTTEMDGSDGLIASELPSTRIITNLSPEAPIYLTLRTDVLSSRSDIPEMLQQIHQGRAAVGGTSLTLANEQLSRKAS